MAENRQRSAKSQLVVAQAKVAEAEANVAQSRAAVERAEEELRNATIRAPMRGMVLTRDVEIGSPVSSILNLGVGAHAGDDARRHRAASSSAARSTRPTSAASSWASRRGSASRPSRTAAFDGKVTQISPIGVEKDNVTTFEVEVSIDNPGNELKANMTANAEIVLEEHPNVLIVPEAAIVYDASKNAFVEVPDAERADAAAAGRREAGRRQRHPHRDRSRREGRRSRAAAAIGRLPDVRTMREAIVQSLENLRANKLRSVLTMFGILWGIVSIVVLSAMGEGFRRGNDAVLREFGHEHRHRLGRPHQHAGRRRARRPRRSA